MAWCRSSSARHRPATAKGDDGLSDLLLRLKNGIVSKRDTLRDVLVVALPVIPYSPLARHRPLKMLFESTPMLWDGPDPITKSWASHWTKMALLPVFRVT